MCIIMLWLAISLKQNAYILATDTYICYIILADIIWEALLPSVTL